MADGYEEFVRTRGPALLRAAYLLTGDQHLAEDLVQDALARTHRAWHVHGVDNAEAYARKIMYHAQVSLWRRRRVREFYPSEMPERASGDHAESVSVRVSLERALARLSPRQRAMVVLRYFEDRTEAETAELLGMALGTVKTHTARALDRLRGFAPELGELMIDAGEPR